jgi:hypothetical protein
MFGYKSFLKVGALNDSSITGLYRDSYELESCDYSFSQPVDVNGKPQSDVCGGSIYLTYANVPPMELLRWMLKSSRYEDGVIVICDENDEPLEKVEFERARCIGLEVNYLQKGKAYTTTKITLQASKIKMGGAELDNHWII